MPFAYYDAKEAKFFNIDRDVVREKSKGAIPPLTAREEIRRTLDSARRPVPTTSVRGVGVAAVSRRAGATGLASALLSRMPAVIAPSRTATEAARRVVAARVAAESSRGVGQSARDYRADFRSREAERAAYRSRPGRHK